MIEIVIIGQNESGSILKMYNSLKEYSFRKIWILDRCSDNSEEILDSLSEEYYTTDSNLKGRQTSYSRNLGLSYTNPLSDVIFLDGDRSLEKGDLNDLLISKHDIELLLLEDDARLERNIEDCYGHVYNGFFSCGLFMKRKAINQVLEYQNGELFLLDIQNDWGIEDVYLGDLCYHLELTCNFNKNIILNGRFDKLELDSIDTIQKRFELRDKLNVNW